MTLDVADPPTLIFLHRRIQTCTSEAFFGGYNCLMIRLALIALSLIFPVSHFSLGQTQRAFLPYGYYSIQGEAPKGFQNIDSIQYWRQDSSGPDVSERLSGVNLVGGTRYRFAAITVNRKNFSFTTRKVNGVHYSFSGRFLRTDFLDDELTEEKAVARGTLVKYKNGIRVARANITLSYFAGT